MLADGCEGAPGTKIGERKNNCHWSSSLSVELLQEIARHVGSQSWGSLRCVCRSWRHGISLAVCTVRLTVPDRSTALAAQPQVEPAAADVQRPARRGTAAGRPTGRAAATPIPNHEEQAPAAAMVLGAGPNSAAVPFTPLQPAAQQQPQQQQNQSQPQQHHHQQQPTATGRGFAASSGRPPLHAPLPDNGQQAVPAACVTEPAGDTSAGRVAPHLRFDRPDLEHLACVFNLHHHSAVAAVAAAAAGAPGRIQGEASDSHAAGMASSVASSSIMVWSLLEAADKLTAAYPAFVNLSLDFTEPLPLAAAGGGVLGSGRWLQLEISAALQRLLSDRLVSLTLSGHTPYPLVMAPPPSPAQLLQHNQQDEQQPHPRLQRSSSRAHGSGDDDATMQEVAEAAAEGREQLALDPGLQAQNPHDAPDAHVRYLEDLIHQGRPTGPWSNHLLVPGSPGAFTVADAIRDMEGETAVAAGGGLGSSGDGYDVSGAGAPSRRRRWASPPPAQLQAEIATHWPMGTDSLTGATAPQQPDSAGCKPGATPMTAGSPVPANGNCGSSGSAPTRGSPSARRNGSGCDGSAGNHQGSDGNVHHQTEADGSGAIGDEPPRGGGSGAVGDEPPRGGGSGAPNIPAAAARGDSAIGDAAEPMDVEAVASLEVLMEANGSGDSNDNGGGDSGPGPTTRGSGPMDALVERAGGCRFRSSHHNHPQPSPANASRGQEGGYGEGGSGGGTPHGGGHGGEVDDGGGGSSGGNGSHRGRADDSGFTAAAAPVAAATAAGDQTHIASAGGGGGDLRGGKYEDGAAADGAAAAEEGTAHDAAAEAAELVAVRRPRVGLMAAACVRPAACFAASGGTGTGAAGGRWVPAMAPAAAGGMRLPPLLSRLSHLASLTIAADLGFPSPQNLEAITGLRGLQKLDMRGSKFMQVDGDASLLGRQAWLHVSNEHLAVVARCTSLTSLSLNHLHPVAGSQLAALKALSRLTSLALTDALSGNTVHSTHIKALAKELPGLRSLEVGRVTCPPPMHLMQQPPAPVAAAPVAAAAAEGPGAKQPQAAGAVAGAMGARTASPSASPSSWQPWGPVLGCFEGLTSLHLQVACSFETELLAGVAALPLLESFSMELLDVPPPQLAAMLMTLSAGGGNDAGGLHSRGGRGDSGSPRHGRGGAEGAGPGAGADFQCAGAGRALSYVLHSLTLTACMLYDEHLVLMGRLTHLRNVRLDQVDIRTRDPDGWTALSPLRNLVAFSFRVWNNPVLSAGNLCVLTNDSLAMMAANWPRLQQLSYCGKVTLTEKAQEHLARMSCLISAEITGTAGTSCRVWRSAGTGQLLRTIALPYTAAKVSSRNGYVTYSDSDDSEGSEASVNWMGEMGYVTSEYDAD